MSRVMHCVSNLRFGGVERLLADVLTYWARHGARHEHVLCAFAGGPLEEQTIPVLDGANMRHHVLGRTSRYSAAFRRALVRAVNDVQPDIVNTCDPGAAFWKRLLLNRFHPRPRNVVQCGGVGVFLQRMWRGIERFLLPRADGFIFCSETTRRIWEHYLPIGVRRCVIHNGIPAEKTGSPGSHPPSALPASPFRLLSISRLVPIKGIAAQIDALRLLHDRGMDDITLTLVGDGAARTDLEARVRRLALGKAITFTGFQSQRFSQHVLQ
jgi:glycosyltransferase involved in cell wall biosynthesis